MQRSLFWKALTVAGLTLALLLPLAMVENQIQGRNQRQREVRENVAASAAGRQQLIGPLLVLSYTERVMREVKNEGSGRLEKEWVNTSSEQVFVPKDLEITGTAGVEERHRGLYKAQLYHWNANLAGRFMVPKGFGLEAHQVVNLRELRLELGLSDLRGIGNRPLLRSRGETYEFASGPAREGGSHGIHVELGRPEALEGHEFPFEIPLELTGSQSLSVAPVAESTRMNLHSDWPSPSFGGRFLPLRSQIGTQGFDATWQVFHLSRNLPRILEAKGCTEEAFDVAFLEPVNIYLQSERAVKYGLLFVGLTFAAFFLFELLKRLPIHPMQYLLVGLALAMFFLLLISISEHLHFLWAYLIASGASIALLSAYLVNVLRSRLRGLGFGGALTLLFGVLYGLLQSEDNALLMGAVLLFAALSAVMMATRELDWYGLSSPKAVGD